MTRMFKIALPDGSVKEMPAGSTPADVAAAIGPGLAKAALAAKVDGEIRDITRPFEGDASLALITSRDEAEALELVRHDFAHILAEAVQARFPGTHITFGPASTRSAHAPTSAATAAIRKRTGSTRHRAAATASTPRSIATVRLGGSASSTSEPARASIATGRARRRRASNAERRSTSRRCAWRGRAAHVRTAATAGWDFPDFRVVAR